VARCLSLRGCVDDETVRLMVHLPDGEASFLLERVSTNFYAQLLMNAKVPYEPAY
jgi:hypothetical protein